MENLQSEPFQAAFPNFFIWALLECEAIPGSAKMGLPLHNFQIKISYFYLGKKNRWNLMVTHNPRNVQNKSFWNNLHWNQRKIPLVFSVLNWQKQCWLRRRKRGKSDYFVWHCNADFRGTNLSAIRMFVKAWALRVGFVLGSGSAQIPGRRMLSWEQPWQSEHSGIKLTILHQEKGPACDFH